MPDQPDQPTRHGIPGIHPALANKTREELLELGKWWNVPEDEQVELMAAETAVHPWGEMIEARLNAELARGTVYCGRPGETVVPWDGSMTDSTSWGNTVTVTRIAVQWLGLSSDTLGRGTATAKTIGTVMRGLGWEARRIRLPGAAQRPWVFVRPEIDMGQDSGNNQAGESDESPCINSGDEEIPF